MDKSNYPLEKIQRSFPSTYHALVIETASKELLVDSPAASDLQIFHQYNGEAPDGIAFGKSGNLYVALAAPFNSGVSILAPGGGEVARLTNPVGSPIFPYDSPANIAFAKQGSILLTNHAFATMIPSNFTVLDVFVDDKESPLVRPTIP